MEIEKILASHQATTILKEYDTQGRVVAVCFQYKMKDGNTIPFKLPLKIANLKAVTDKLVDGKKIPKRYRNDTDKSLRIGWRIIKDWIDAQMALIEIEMVDLPEVFLPYAFSIEHQKTAYELIGDGHFKGYLTEATEDKEVRAT